MEPYASPARSMRLFALAAILLLTTSLTVAAQPPSPTAPGATTTGCGDEEDAPSGPDCRDDIGVSVFTGISVDSFAANELHKYRNDPEDATKASEQIVAGFDFEFRMAGSRESRWPSVWLYGETVHGARSGEAKCEDDKNKQTDICKVAALDATAATTPSAPLAIFRKAQTLEAMMGVRLEFAKLRQNSDSAASVLYLKGQLGLLTVAGKGGDVVDMHHGALGVMLTRGSLLGSYLEAGYGINELFIQNPHRFKIDGFLSINIKNKAVRPFAQMVIDADFKDGPDTIQSYFGFDIDVLDVWK